MRVFVGAVSTAPAAFDRHCNDSTGHHGSMSTVPLSAHWYVFKAVSSQPGRDRRETAALQTFEPRGRVTAEGRLQASDALSRPTAAMHSSPSLRRAATTHPRTLDERRGRPSCEPDFCQIIGRYFRRAAGQTRLSEAHSHTDGHGREIVARFPGRNRSQRRGGFRAVGDVTEAGIQGGSLGEVVVVSRPHRERVQVARSCDVAIDGRDADRVQADRDRETQRMGMRVGIAGMLGPSALKM